MTLPRLVPALTLLLLAALAPPRLHAQASELPSAAPPSPADFGQTSDQRGRTLLNQMVAALGGAAWLTRTSMEVDGRTAAFFQGAPDPGVIEYHELIRFAAPNATPPQPEAERVGFLTERGMILPGKKIDVVQIYTAGHGYEVTFKGQTELPKDQVEEHNRRLAHSIEDIIGNWLKAPGVMVVAGGATMVQRRIADKVTILSADNDAVTLELDAATHLPLRRTFQWRNQQFKDFDEDVEEYDDYHTIQGFPTALTITRYKNGDMVSQRFLTKVTYNVPITPSLFDPATLLPKKK